MLEPDCINSPQLWDALLAARGRDPALLLELEALPASAPLDSGLRAARLAQAHLVTGRSDYALQALAAGEPHPLKEVTRLAVRAARHDYSEVLERSEALLETIKEARGELGLEVRARLLHTRATALWGERQLERAASTAREAMRLATENGMSHFAHICEMLWQDARALRLEVTPAARERELREVLLHCSPEERIEALINLVQLMYRQGRYEESMRLSQEIPTGRQGRFFQAISLIANRAAGAVNWATLPEGLDYGRLHAVHGLLQLDADLVLSGPTPRDEAPLTRRHVAEWQLAFGWASARNGRLEAAAAYLEAPFVHRTEWDLRLVRAATWLELLVVAPEFTLARCNAAAMFEDARRLLEEYIAPNSVLVQMLPRAAPSAVALLVAAPGGCKALAALAERDLVVLGGHGLCAGGLTRTRADSMLRVLRGEPLETLGATRAARYRLRRLLRQRGQVAVIEAGTVLAALHALAARASQEPTENWGQATARYRDQHGLE